MGGRCDGPGRGTARLGARQRQLGSDVGGGVRGGASAAVQVRARHHVPEPVGRLGKVWIVAEWVSPSPMRSYRPLRAVATCSV